MSNIWLREYLFTNAVCNKSTTTEKGIAAKLILQFTFGGEEHPGHVQAGRDVGRSVAQPPAQSRVSPDIRQGCSGLRLILKTSKSGDPTASLEPCSSG